MSVLDFILHHAESPKARAAQAQRERHDGEIDRIRIGIDRDVARERQRVRRLLGARVEERRCETCRTYGPPPPSLSPCVKCGGSK